VIFRRLLVPLKPGTFSADLIDVVADEARAADALVTFVAAVEPPDLTGTGRASAAALDVMRERRSAAETTVRRAAERAASRGIQTQTIVEHGHKIDVIVQAAAHTRSDLIVLFPTAAGSLSRGTGRLADALLRGAADVPVLLRPFPRPNPP
jgi:hypothetical protein